MVHVIEPDDGQGWIKVRLEVQGDSLEGLVPAGYVELLPTGSTTPQYRPQVATHVSPAVSPVAQPVTHHMSPVSSPVRHIASPGFPFNPPTMPGSYSPSSPPVPPMQSRPSIPTQGAFGQGERRFELCSCFHADIRPDVCSHGALRLYSSRIGRVCAEKGRDLQSVEERHVLRRRMVGVEL
jgi:hypothetical protein